MFSTELANTSNITIN